MRPAATLTGAIVVSAWCGFGPSPAEADIVFLTSGRSLSVRSVRIEEGRALLTLRQGGEIECNPALIARVAPDEIPYPGEAGDPVEGLDDLPFARLIEQLAARHGVPAALVHAVIHAESAYDTRALSTKGAMGLMQLMPATAEHYGVTEPYDPGANLDGGIRHLRSLLLRYDLPRALAAYNAGIGAVERFRGIPPYQETRLYVRKVMATLSALTARPSGSPGSPSAQD